MTGLIEYEEWLPVVGWEGLYEVSSHGRVRSIARVLIRSNGYKQTVRSVILSPAPRPGGYRSVNLSDTVNGRRQSFFTHRLVCEAFHGPAPEGKPNVLHWDDNTANNHYSNLRWGDQSDNRKDNVRNGTYVNWGMLITHCKRGHPLSGSNLYVPPKEPTARKCRECRRIKAKEFYERLKEKEELNG